jgi:hypothetical protein
VINEFFGVRVGAEFPIARGLGIGMESSYNAGSDGIELQQFVALRGLVKVWIW